MTDAELHILQRLIVREASVLIPKPDCLTCSHSLGADLATAQHLVATRGFSRGKSDFRHGIGLICSLHARIAPTPCADYSRQGDG